MGALLPPPDISADYVDAKTNRPSKDFYNWIKSLYDHSRGGRPFIFVGDLSPPVSPDGSDQENNLQGAIDHYSDAGGAVFLFGIGTYAFYSSIVLKPNIILRGCGIDLTILKVFGAGDFHLISNWDVVGNDTGIAGIEDMTLWGYADRSGYVQDNGRLVAMGPFNSYWMRRVKAIYSSNMSLTGFGGTGYVEDCIVNKSLRDGINLTSTDHVFINNNDISEVGDDAIAHHVASGTGAARVIEQSARVVGNRIEKAFGIKLLGITNAVVANNTLRFYYGYGVQYGFDGNFNQGLNTRFSIAIMGNSLVDGLNANEIGGGNLGTAIFMHGGEYLGSVPDAIPVYVGQHTGGSPGYIQTSDAFINKTGITLPLGPTQAITITGNTIIQTVNGITHFSDLGLGLLWNSSGPLDIPIATLIGEVTGIRIADDMQNLTINGNAIHGVFFGMLIEGALANAKICNNTLFRIVANGIHLSPISIVAPTVSGQIDITGNLFDIDPYFEAPTHGLSDGAWTVADGASLMGISITNYTGVSISRNRFRNCIRPVKFIGGLGLTNYVNDRNICEFDWESGVIPYRGVASPSGLTAVDDIFWYVDSNPQNATYNQFDPNFVFSAGSMPTAGWFYRGTFVRNFSPTADGNGMVILGWIRNISGNTHVAGTDWYVAYVSNVSPAV